VSWPSTGLPSVMRSRVAGRPCHGGAADLATRARLQDSVRALGEQADADRAELERRAIAHDPGCPPDILGLDAPAWRVEVHGPPATQHSNKSTILAVYNLKNLYLLTRPIWSKPCPKLCIETCQSIHPYSRPLSSDSSPIRVLTVEGNGGTTNLRELVAGPA
jgi:hypothetical protein